MSQLVEARALRRLGLFLGLLLAAAEATAQISGSFALLSDNRFRGVSLSDRRPALQAGIAYDHASGLFAGALASTVMVDGADSSLSAQGYVGFAYPLSQRLAFDAGGARYVYPQPVTAGSYDYTEVFAGVVLADVVVAGVALDRVQARLHYSDDYFGGGARALYTDINSAIDLSPAFALVAHLGYLARSAQTSTRPGVAPSTQWDAKLGLVTEVAGLNLELSVVGTDVPLDRCPGSYRACAPGLVFAVSREF
jgi:uncharacterized protein (TIGR02001 family)